VATGGGRP